MMMRTISCAALSMSVTLSASASAPTSMSSLLMNSICFQWGRCCSLLSSWEVRSRALALMPLSARKAGMARVPSGVSWNVLGSLSEALLVFFLSFLSSVTNRSSNDLTLENSCLIVAKSGSTASSDVRICELSPSA